MVPLCTVAAAVALMAMMSTPTFIKNLNIYPKPENLSKMQIYPKTTHLSKTEDWQGRFDNLDDFSDYYKLLLELAYCQLRIKR